MWIDDEQMEIYGILTNLSIGEKPLVFQTKFVGDEKYAKWGVPGNIYIHSFNAAKQRTIDRIIDKVEAYYISLLEKNFSENESLELLIEILIRELTAFENRVKGYLIFHQLKLLDSSKEGRIVWQSPYFEDIYVDKFFDIYE